MGLLTDLLDLVLPQQCAGCGNAPGLLCEPCRGLLSSSTWQAVPSPAPAGLPSPWAVARYEGAVRAMIVAHKESGRTGLARPLGAALSRSVLAASLECPATETAGLASPLADPASLLPGTLGAPVLVVPVPSTRAAVRLRGHDPTMRITAAVVAVLRSQGVKAGRAAVLTHTRRVADQADLTAAGRAANLAGAFVVDRPDHVSGRRVVVVDDVITTGATLAEAARALREAGAEVPSAAVIAATQRWPRRLRPDPIDG